MGNFVFNDNKSLTFLVVMKRSTLVCYLQDKQIFPLVISGDLFILVCRRRQSHLSAGPLAVRSFFFHFIFQRLLLLGSSEGKHCTGNTRMVWDRLKAQYVTQIFPSMQLWSFAILFGNTVTPVFKNHPIEDQKWSLKTGGLCSHVIFLSK